ncbi:MAG TPA: CRTAC1 family protein, partial [Pirellula sp.]|nr:CRTAC1 family protein [Pirellula sp.]
YDYDDNGHIDLWVANYEREANAIYQNQGNGQFQHMSRSTGVTAVGGSFVGFGTEMFDLDFDGHPEIICTNGHVIKFPTAAPRQQLPIFISYDGKRFVRQNFPRTDFFSMPHEGRGLALGDLNGDGAQDVVISHLNQPLTVLINKSPIERNRVRVHLIGTVSSRDAIGSRIVSTMNGKESIKQIVGGGSYLSSSHRDVWLVFPEGSQELTISIRWPSGMQNVDVSIPCDAGVITLIEP